MGLGALIAIILVSLLAGIVVQVRGTKKTRYDFLIVGATAAFGAYFASETFPGSSVFGTITSWGPEIDGFLLIPGIAFGFIVAIVSYAGSRGSYFPSPDAA